VANRQEIGGPPDRRGAILFGSRGKIATFIEPVHYSRRTRMPKKQSSSKMSTLASKVLSGEKKPTTTDAKKLAASVLSQDEKKGQRK
jgi:hypothetical protein